MTAIVGLLVVAAVAVAYGLLVRGAVSGHDIAHDGPALVAYIVAIVAVNAAGWLLGRWRSDQ